jgi:hypothetical protein
MGTSSRTGVFGQCQLLSSFQLRGRLLVVGERGVRWAALPYPNSLSVRVPLLFGLLHWKYTRGLAKPTVEAKGDLAPLPLAVRGGG